MKLLFNGQNQLRILALAQLRITYARREKRMAKEKFDVKKMVSDKLIKLLEAEIAKGDDAKWIRSWNISNVTNQNFNSKRVYRGFLNQLFLAFAGFESPYWNTYEGWREQAYRQWAKRNKVKLEKADIDSARSKKKNKFEKQADWLSRQTDNVKQFMADGGGGVATGAKAEFVTYNAKVDNKKFDENDPTNPDNGPKQWWILRYFKVFNSEQTFNVEVPDYKGEEREFTPIEAAEKIWKEFTNKPEFKHRGNRAHYIPAIDLIELPKPEKFHTNESYYKTLFHEAVHATGHETRLKRAGITELAEHTGKAERYGMEELIAEMGACMLAANCGLDDSNGDSEKNSVAYLRGWIKRLKDDTAMAQKASTKAAAAFDHILGVEYDTDDKKEDKDANS